MAHPKRDKGKCQRCKKVRPLNAGEVNYGLCSSCCSYETKRRMREREGILPQKRGRKPKVQNTEFETPVTYANPPREEIVEEPVMQPEPPKAEPKPEPTHASDGELSPPSSVYVRNIPFTPNMYLNEPNESMNIADFIGAINRYYYCLNQSMMFYMLGIAFIMFTAWLCVVINPMFLMASSLMVYCVWKGMKMKREAYGIALDMGMVFEPAVKAEVAKAEKKPFLGGLFKAKPKAASKDDW